MFEALEGGGLAGMYLVRHGETVWNRMGRLQGQADSPLTARGVKQAVALGDLLRVLVGEQDVRLLASPLPRAHQTAVLIAEAMGRDPASITLDGRLKEITLGVRDGYEGWGALDRDFPEEAERRRADPWHYVHPGGESSELVRVRVSPVLAEVMGHPIPSVVIAHGVVNKILRGIHLKLSADAIFALDRPQDVVHRFHADGIDTHQAEPVD